jgi:hypothetical protein
MTAIQQIAVEVNTNNISGAGTDGDVFLGICGREFRLDTSQDDFEAGTIARYLLGEQANIRNEDRNDPRNPQLDTDDLDRFPMYMRFDPVDSDSDWNVTRVSVDVEGRNYGAFFQKGLWLSQRSGKFFYLREGLFGE